MCRTDLVIIASPFQIGTKLTNLVLDPDVVIKTNYTDP